MSIESKSDLEECKKQVYRKVFVECWLLNIGVLVMRKIL